MLFGFTVGAEDTLRSKVRTGKTMRMLRSRMTDAWEQPDAPRYLDTPLQGIMYNEVHARILRSQRKELISIPAGQALLMWCRRRRYAR